MSSQQPGGGHVAALSAITPAWMRVGAFVSDQNGLTGRIIATDIDDDNVIAILVKYTDSSSEWYYFEDAKPAPGPTITPLVECPNQHESVPGTSLMVYRCQSCGGSVCKSCGIAGEGDSPDVCYNCLSDEAGAEQ